LQTACAARRIVDRHVLALIKMWLKALVEERGLATKRRSVGGKGNTRGTPAGGVASPLLADIYMNRFLKHWRLSGVWWGLSRPQPWATLSTASQPPYCSSMPGGGMLSGSYRA
jgi:hypothetical protein